MIKTLFARLPIRRKIGLPVAAAAGLAIVAVVSTLFITEWVATRRSLSRQLEVLAQIISDNAQAVLAFKDVARGTEMLSALRAKDNLTAAVLLDKQNRLFASYIHPSATITPEWQGPDGTEIDARRLLTRQPVVLDSERVGTIVLEESLEPLYTRLRGVLVIAIVLTAIIATLVHLLSSILQRSVAAPIAELAATAGSIQASRNYSLRAAKTNDDELGLLQEAFNSMLTVIEQRSHDLEVAHHSLENKVRERTTELRQEVAERRRAETELRAFSRKLEQSNRDLEDFAYVASHDLQEPLRKIQAFSDRLAKSLEGKLDSRGSDYLERMRSAADRMRVLITDILTLSRVSTRGKDFEPMDLMELIRSVESDLEISIHEAQATILVEPLPRVLGDPPQIRQLFQNLLSNALKFRRTDRDLVIRIESDSHENDSSAEKTDHATIRVIDNGIGFENEHAERIFGVFQRLHGRDHYQGTGIGLAICRRIVERHGGRIVAASDLELGTTFTITLPGAGSSAESAADQPVRGLQNA